MRCEGRAGHQTRRCLCASHLRRTRANCSPPRSRCSCGRSRRWRTFSGYPMPSPSMSSRRWAPGVPTWTTPSPSRAGCLGQRLRRVARGVTGGEAGEGRVLLRCGRAGGRERDLRGGAREPRSRSARHDVRPGDLGERYESRVHPAALSSLHRHLGRHRPADLDELRGPRHSGALGDRGTCGVRGGGSARGPPRGPERRALRRHARPALGRHVERLPAPGPRLGSPRFAGRSRGTPSPSSASARRSWSAATVGQRWSKGSSTRQSASSPLRTTASPPRSTRSTKRATSSL